MTKRPRFSTRIVAVLTLLAAGAANAAEWPRPPCGGLPVPPYPAVKTSPAILSRSAAGWTPPGCLGWDGSAPKLLVAISGRLHEPGGTDGILARFGAVSALRGVRYWSVTDQAWLTLIHDASAVTDGSGASRRSDFRPDELKLGVPLYMAERDGRSSGMVVYKMRVTEHMPNRVVVTVVNVSPVRVSLVTLFAPGDLQTTYFLERLGPDEWGYFGLWGVTTGLLTGGHEASSINRAMSLYRHFAGIPSDQEPPAAR